MYGSFSAGRSRIRNPTPAGGAVIAVLSLVLAKSLCPGRQTDLHPLEFSDQPVAHDFRRVMKMFFRTLPRTRLPDALVLLHGPHHRLLLANGAGQRFLAVNILALPRRLHRHQRVPMIRRGQHHRINILPRKQLPIVMIRRTILILDSAH
jgi:hypothetical protein